MTEKQQPDPGDSTVLKAQFGENWRAWRWLRKQFSTTSIAVIVGGLGGLGGWALNLKTRVVILEERVVPVLDERRQEAENRTAIGDLKDRVSRLEDNYDTAQREAATAPRKGRRP